MTPARSRPRKLRKGRTPATATSSNDPATDAGAPDLAILTPEERHMLYAGCDRFLRGDGSRIPSAAVFMPSGTMA